ASYKLARVKKVERGPKGIPYAITHDGRTIRYPDPDIKAHDTVRIDIGTGKIKDHLKFEPGQRVMISGGNNMGRVGDITHRERHPGSFEIVHVKDPDNNGHAFATRMQNVFVIGTGGKPWISLPKGNGEKLSIIEDRPRRAHGQVTGRAAAAREGRGREGPAGGFGAASIPPPLPRALPPCSLGRPPARRHGPLSPAPP
ncbi:unnamed protein product, partial [Prorocentrum cordatum]